MSAAMLARAGACAAGVLLLALAAPAATSAEPGRHAVARITYRIEKRDCSGAVEELKDGLKEKYREVAMLAGIMFEYGLCVRRDWSHAMGFYRQAYEAGMKEGAERLAAGFADPANGPDVAAALWWAWKGRALPDARCEVGEDAADDPDRFVAELSTWGAERLAYCNYVAGVTSTIASELRYPELARTHSIGGDVVLRFLPGVPRIELQKGESREYALLGWVSGDMLRDRGSKLVTGSIEKALSEVANRALARYPQPAGIPADALVKMKYIFTIEYK
jgi:hypothetical protein